tara:strand:+ start:445 stop:633 length:189 start_codon:yes stop_codon:yes gene_type:complete
MINRTNFNVVSQIVEGMSELSMRINEAYKNQDIKTLELTKRELIEFQKRLSQELKEIKEVKK